MEGQPGSPSRQRIGPLLAGTLLFVFFAPVGLVLLPLAAMLLLSSSWGRRERLVLVGSTFFGMWWLLGIGEAPEQTMRAAALVGAIVYAMLTVTTRISTTHKGLVASVAGGIAVMSGFLASGVSWAEVSWAVEHRIGFMTRRVLGGMWTQPDPEVPLANSTILMLGEAEKIFDGMARFAGANFAALLTLEMLVGFAIATAIYHRVSEKPLGVANGRLRSFAFSEHIGWIVVFGLAGLLLPRLALYKAVAGNFIVVAAAIYALRGAAVVSFAMTATGGSVFLTILLGLAFVFMLPVVAVGAIVIGILDTGLNIRNRWLSPPARG
jgi:hypothetical protein